MNTYPPLPPSDLDWIVTALGSSWEELRGARLFLTGGTGFFGSWLLESFMMANSRLGLDASVTVLSRDPLAFLARNPFLKSRVDLEVVGGDLRHFAFPPGEFSHVIHAGASPGGGLLPVEMFDTIVEGTRRTVEFAQRAKTKKMLFVSSGAVYGIQPPGLPAIPEDYVGAPDLLSEKAAYGEGKRAAEFLCHTMCANSGPEVKIARCFAFCGPRLPLNGTFAIGNFIRDALSGGPVRIQGDGSPVRSYLYPTDLAVWLWTILFHGPRNRSFNVGDGQGLDLATVADRVNNVLGGGGVEIGRRLVMGGLPDLYVPDVSRATKELSLRITVSLDEIIRRTAAWGLAVAP